MYYDGSRTYTAGNRNSVDGVNCYLPQRDLYSRGIIYHATVDQVRLGVNISNLTAAQLSELCHSQPPVVFISLHYSFKLLLLILYRQT
jgi:hypothetical protein